MQEIKWDGTEGERKEGSIKELLPEIEKSMQKEDVAKVIVSKEPTLKIPGRNNKKSRLTEQRVREIIREELKAFFMEQDPLY